MNRTKKAIVIGAGIGGLAVSVRLAQKGYKVDVYEANGYPGGKLSQIQLDGFRFDAGPSLFTMPEQLTELFELTGKQVQQYFSYDSLDTLCHYFYEDGTMIRAFREQEKFASEIALKTEDEEDVVLKALRESQELYQITSHVFLERSLHKLSTYLRVDTLKSVLKLHKLNALQTMNGANTKRFKDARTIQLFNRFATYNGSNPYQAPATLHVIPHLEHNQGAYFPHKGMHHITSSTYELAKSCGVQFHFNKKVQEILVKEKKAAGIKVDDEEIKADIVVSNMDIVPTYKKLLSKEKAPEKVLTQERSSSALIFYWGIKGVFPSLELHNIFFSSNYQEEFEYIWKHKSLYSDPTIYVNITSKHKESDAPQGCENWFVMINVPHLDGHDWDNLSTIAKEIILKKLSRMLSVDIGPLIECEALLTPQGIQDKTSSYLGALYGSSSNSMWSAFLRHPNFSQSIEGLYFCGGSVHPGGGIPLSLLSARIVSELIPSL